MKRSANILIKKVKNDSNNVLKCVKASLLLDGKMSEEIELSKNDVIFLIEDGDIIKTTYKDTKEESWNIGSKVNVVTIGKEKYLRTDSNSISKDNLDKLPNY